LLGFSLERLAEKMFEIFSQVYDEHEGIRDYIKQLKRKKECLDRDPYCPEVFEKLVAAIVT